jgi:hypothetical protein
MTSLVTNADVTMWTGCTKPFWDYVSDRWACGCFEPPTHGYDGEGWLFLREYDPGQVLRST